MTRANNKMRRRHCRRLRFFAQDIPSVHVRPVCSSGGCRLRIGISHVFPCTQSALWPIDFIMGIEISDGSGRSGVGKMMPLQQRGTCTRWNAAFLRQKEIRTRRKVIEVQHSALQERRQWRSFFEGLQKGEDSLKLGFRHFRKFAQLRK